MTTKTRRSKTYGMQQRQSSKKEVYSNTILPQETRKSQVNNLTLHLKELEKEGQTKPKVSGRKEIIKIRSRNK